MCGRCSSRCRPCWSATRSASRSLLLAFWPIAPWPRIGGWLLLALLLLAARLAHYLRYRARRDADAETVMRWRTSWRVLVLMQGVMWPLAVWLFWGMGFTFHTVALVLIAMSYALGSVQLLAAQPMLFIAFTSIVLVPIIVRVATDTAEAWHWQLALVLGLLFLITLLLGRTYRDALAQAIVLKQQTEHLAEQLKHEKAVADEARRAAETANRAKTQFFAAASHDLRQPLHAMGLFAEALRQRSQQGKTDPEVASLVNSINQSVDALEGLFGELLDLTRIDSGGVDVQPAPVRIKDLFSRLRLTFEPVAFEKGLALSFHGAQRVAHSDGLLVERILRNLVSNAIRYTEDGGVLVACRPKPNDNGKLLLQVWDSGVGISRSQPAAHLRRVLSGARQRAAGRAPEEGLGPRPGDRQEARRFARSAIDRALGRRPRHRVLARSAGGPRTAHDFAAAAIECCAPRPDARRPAHRRRRRRAGGA